MFDGEPIAGDCRVSDVSRNGAKIIIDAATEIGTRSDLRSCPIIRSDSDARSSVSVVLRPQLESLDVDRPTEATGRCYCSD
jgi:hypothetical protein